MEMHTPRSNLLLKTYNLSLWRPMRQLISAHGVEERLVGPLTIPARRLATSANGLINHKLGLAYAVLLNNHTLLTDNGLVTPGGAIRHFP